MCRRLCRLLAFALAVSACNGKTGQRRDPAVAGAAERGPAAGSPSDDRLSTPPAGSPEMRVEAKGDEVVLEHRFADEDERLLTPREALSVALLNEPWADEGVRGKLELRPGERLRVTSISAVSAKKVRATILAPVTVTAARHYGAAGWPGVRDKDARRSDLTLSPADSLELVMRRPDGGCIYRLADGLATLPCLSAEIAKTGSEPGVVTWLGTPFGVSGRLRVDDAKQFEEPHVGLWPRTARTE